MASLTQVTIPTSETVPKELPEVALRDGSDLNTILLAGLLLLAILTGAYIAAEVVRSFSRSC